MKNGKDSERISELKNRLAESVRQAAGVPVRCRRPVQR